MNKYYDLFFATHGVQHIAPAPVQVDSVHALYMQGIAMPEVAIVDRRQEFVPVVLDENGQELTLERRQKLWEGRKRISDLNGDARNFDFRKELEDAVELQGESRIGTAAKKLRPGIRRVPTKEIKVLPEITYEPFKVVTTDLSGNEIEHCVCSTGMVLEHWNVKQYLTQLVGEVRLRTDRAVTEVRMSDPALRTLRYHYEQWLKEYFLGAKVIIDPSMDNKLVFTVDKYPDEVAAPCGVAWLELMYE